MIAIIMGDTRSLDYGSSRYDSLHYNRYYGDLQYGTPNYGKLHVFYQTRTDFSELPVSMKGRA